MSKNSAVTVCEVALPHTRYACNVELDTEEPGDHPLNDPLRLLRVLISVEIRESARTEVGNMQPSRLSYQATLRLNPFDAQTLASAILAHASEALARSGM
jgi:hypothetical protein